jgi:hypothetical protein
VSHQFIVLMCRSSSVHAQRVDARFDLAGNGKLLHPCWETIYNNQRMNVVPDTTPLTITLIETYKNSNTRHHNHIYHSKHSSKMQCQMSIRMVIPHTVMCIRFSCKSCRWVTEPFHQLISFRSHVNCYMIHLSTYPNLH